MLVLKNIRKEYINKDNHTKALNGINLTFNDAGLYFVLGPSGSGKTTLLNIIGCLDKATSGEMIVDERNINTYNSLEIDMFRNENIGFIFQDYSLIPHLTVLENVCLPLNVNKISEKEIYKKSKDLLEKFGLHKELNKYPSQLSGGQLQRAAIARALITDPKVILADEPTGALDSENAKILMEYLKEISKEKLIIMVSHNEKLALEYGDTIIELVDGRVKDINQINTLYNKKREKKKNKFKLFSLFTSIKLSFRHLIAKKFRSVFTILGSSIGILAACIVVSISNSMENYSEYAQKQALGTYPITISSSLVNTEKLDDEKKEHIEYSDTNRVNVINEYMSYYSHVNFFSNDYIEYLKGLDSNLYTTMDYGNFLSLNIISKKENQYSYVGNTSYLKEVNSEQTYLESEYDLLYGDSYPDEIGELALVVDKNNCIDAYVLNYLQIDYKGIDFYTFDDICKKEFKVIFNNDYYIYNESLDRYEVYANEYDENKQKELYDNATLTLRITAILRCKKDAENKLYNPGLLYTSKLTEYMHENNSNSDIVKEQLKYGLDKNVLTGLPYADTVTDFYVMKKEYKLESNLKELGYYFSISYIKIYTDKFENRTLINEYLKAYNNDKEEDRKVLYNDYMGNLTKEFENFIDILMLVFLIFSFVSIVVSGIMIAILMYVSVMERTKEIGILRTLGYTKANVGMVFLLESALIGFMSGVIGIAASLLSTKPILKFVASVVKDSYSSTFDVSTITSSKFNVFQLLFILIGSIIVAMIAALIPAIVAAKKDPVKSMKSNGV